jgi:hypothetical protein
VRRDAAQADRAEAVRRPARAWRRAGILDAGQLAALEQLFPDDRARAGAAFRILLFVFTVVAFCGVFAFMAAVAAGSETALAFLLLTVGGGMTVVTEWLTGPLRRRQGGIEAATSFLALSCLLSGGLWVLARSSGVDLMAHLGLLAAGAAALLAIAAWRWGYPLYAGLAAASLLLALARLPVGRLLWIAVPLAAAAPLVRLGESVRLPPALRSAVKAVLLVGLAGLYAAVHLDSWEHHWVEALARPSLLTSPPNLGPPSAAWRWCALIGMVLVPAGLLIFGVIRRRIAILIAGAAGAAISLVTLYEHTTPCAAWLALTLGSALAIGLALALWRWLESGPGGERHGFTATPLSDDAARLQALEIGAAILTLPHAEPQPAAAPSGFTGGGGRSGGAGASGEF